jgi:hypothetical protein
MPSQALLLAGAYAATNIGIATQKADFDVETHKFKLQKCQMSKVENQRVVHYVPQCFRQ